TASASQARQRSRVPTASASQARQRSRGADRIGLASEAALHGADRIGLASEATLHESRPPGASPYHLACLAASVDSPSYQYVIGRQSSFGSVDRTGQASRNAKIVYLGRYALIIGQSRLAGS
ncbi:MAG: hypothetical protein WBZ19_04650, partial [Chthoniobacterales bacterium]